MKIYINQKEIEVQDSISVKDVYLTQNALCFVTTLIGPGENETVAKAPSFPYIVVEVTKCDKNVLFE